jgi:glycosyltransferase involved in cell wall biosynthesis
MKPAAPVTNAAGSASPLVVVLLSVTEPGSLRCSISSFFRLQEGPRATHHTVLFKHTSTLHAPRDLFGAPAHTGPNGRLSQALAAGLGTTMAELTVVMTVYNGEPYLAPALESLTTQSHQDFSVLVVNDGSTDRSAEILEEYSRRDARIQVIHQPNAGVVAALNKACGLVSSPYLARLDADDISTRDRLERQLYFLKQHREVALLGGAAEFVNASGHFLFRVDFPTNSDEIKGILQKRNVFVSSGVIIRRDALLAVGGYRHALSTAEDYDLWLRIAEHYEVANLADVVVHYRVHLTQATTKTLERQVLAGIGARLSARLRQAGEEDPFWSMDSVSKEQLIRLGIGANDIEDELAKTTASWAKVMGRAGYHDTALMLAKKAWARGRNCVLTRHEVTRFYFASARANLLGGHLVRGLVGAARAGQWQLASLWHRLRGRARGLTG